MVRLPLFIICSTFKSLLPLLSLFVKSADGDSCMDPLLVIWSITIGVAVLIRTESNNPSTIIGSQEPGNRYLSKFLASLKVPSRSTQLILPHTLLIEFCKHRETVSIATGVHNVL